MTLVREDGPEESPDEYDQAGLVTLIGRFRRRGIHDVVMVK